MLTFAATGQHPSLTALLLSSQLTPAQPPAAPAAGQAPCRSFHTSTAAADAGTAAGNGAPAGKGEAGALHKGPTSPPEPAGLTTSSSTGILQEAAAAVDAAATAANAAVAATSGSSSSNGSEAPESSSAVTAAAAATYAELAASVYTATEEVLGPLSLADLLFGLQAVAKKHRQQGLSYTVQVWPGCSTY